MNADPIDAFGGSHFKVLALVDGSLLGSQPRMIAFLEAMVERIGMKALDDPIVYDVALKTIERFGDNEPFEDDGGLTGFIDGVQLVGRIAVSTSHVFIHTWPQQGKLVADVYSCREFMGEAVIEILKVSYSPYKYCIYDMSHFLQWSYDGSVTT